MNNQLITVHLSDGSKIARKAIRIFDEGRRATINYKKAIVLVRRASWLNSGDVWLDPGLYARYEREGDPELNALLAQQAHEIAAQGEHLAPAAQEWTPEEIASHDEWYAAQGEQLAPAAPAINLSADIFNLDHSPSLPRLLFRGHTSQACLIENIHFAESGATLEGTVNLKATEYIPGGALTVRIERSMWLACAFTPIESEGK